ncbi:MAG: hypothetical protein OEY69_06260, partial [Candidatus Krumholzibacteria bacterium]|nr:hypothetical protein [Candidatus Krumholzibacteria bacterium]
MILARATVSVLGVSTAGLVPSDEQPVSAIRRVTSGLARKPTRRNIGRILSIDSGLLGPGRNDFKPCRSDGDNSDGDNSDGDNSDGDNSDG